jgi:hypothetical protein
MKLIDILNESKESKFEEFAEKRLGGATKISENAKEKGGLSMLTYYHFKVKLPYYKEASKGKFDLDRSKKDFKEHLDRFLVRQYGSWQEYYCINKTTLRSCLFGCIQEIVKIDNKHKAK